MRDVGCTPLYQGQGMRHGLTFRNNSYKLRIAGPVLTEHGHGPRHYRRGASHRLRHAFTSHKGLSPHQAATMVNAHTVHCGPPEARPAPPHTHHTDHCYYAVMPYT